MHFRSLILMGLCATLGLASPAFSASDDEPVKKYLFSSSKAKAEEPAKKPGAKSAKKLTPKQKAREEAKAKAKAKEEARAEAKAKAAAAKKLAKEKAEKEAKIAAKAKEAADKKAAKAKAAEELKLARAKAAEEKKLAREKAAKEAKLAKAKALEDARQAKLRAAEERRIAAEQARERELREYASMAIATEGNNGELRSESQAQPDAGFFQTLFGGQQQASLLPETRALDSALELKQGKKKFKVRPEFEPQRVQFSGYPRGTIVVDTAAHFLYFVESGSTARRYGIAVGKDGLQYKGTVKVGDKQEWPRWIPTLEMQKREPKKYGQYKDGMPGGGQNPLGARAIYLYDGKKDTHLRIHGTIAPESIGTNSSNGCFRMINEHVMDLYKRVKIGTQVVVL